MSVKILALDTATERCSVALLVGNTVYSRSEIARVITPKKYCLWWTKS